MENNIISVEAAKVIKYSKFAQDQQDPTMTWVYKSQN